MALGNRKEAEDYFIKNISIITKDRRNAKLYKEIFSKLTDEQFHEMMMKIKEGRNLPAYSVNGLEENMVDYQTIKEYAKKNNIVLEQQLVMTDQDTGLEHITPETYITGIAEVRKQREMLIKNFKYAKNDLTTEDLTGQVIGDSKGSSLSKMEVGMLNASGHTLMAQELYNVKGGSEDGLDMYRKELMETGTANTNTILNRSSVVKSLKTVHFLYRARGIDNNFDEKG